MVGAGVFFSVVVGGLVARVRRVVVVRFVVVVVVVDFVVGFLVVVG